MDIDEIIPGLYQGSRPEPGRHPIDVIVLMAEEYQPKSEHFPSAEAVLHAPINDDPSYMSPAEQAAVCQAADYVVRALQAGKRVLVTCNLGLNRSGVVSALVLRRAYGLSADAAIGRVREARGPWALSNPQFEKLIRRS